MIKRTMKEISILFSCALLLSTAYALVSRQGIFAPGALTHKNISAKNLEMITLSDAKDLFESGTALFIDSRHEYDYKQGAVRGAVNLPLSDFDARHSILENIPKDKKIVVYCNGEQCNSSIELAAKLAERGFTNVNIFFGGWQEWSSAGLPVSK